MPKSFTLTEAERLIPRVGELLREAIRLKSEYAQAEQSIRANAERVMLMGGVVVHREEALAARNRRDEAASQLREAFEQIQEIGCLVKDLDIGLIDFPTRYGGREVYLCRKLGETGIAFWHDVEDGFAGRKPIDQDFRDHHQADDGE